MLLKIIKNFLPISLLLMSCVNNQVSDIQKSANYSLDNYQITELKAVEINIDEKFSVLYLESLSKQKLNIIKGFLGSSNLSIEENFTEVDNQFNGSIKVLFNE